MQLPCVQEQPTLRLATRDVSWSSILMASVNLINQAHFYEAHGGSSDFVALATDGISNSTHVKVWKGFTGKHALLPVP